MLCTSFIWVLRQRCGLDSSVGAPTLTSSTLGAGVTTCAKPADRMRLFSKYSYVPLASPVLDRHTDADPLLRHPFRQPMPLFVSRLDAASGLADRAP